MATIVISWKFAESSTPGTGPLAATFTASSGGLIYWSFGGMEAALTAVTLVVFLAGVRYLMTRSRLLPRDLAVISLATIVYLLSRPEAPLIALLTIGLILAHTMMAAPHSETKIADVRRLTIALLIVGGAFFLLVLFRLLYFGAVFPQPVYAKTGGLNPFQGLDYVWNTGRTQPGLLWALVVAVGIISGRFRCLRVSDTILGSSLLSILAFVIASGGDWMEAGRMLVPAIPLVGVLIASVLHSATTYTRSLILAFLSLQLVGVLNITHSHSTGAVLPAARQLARIGAPLSKRSFAWFERANRVHLRSIPIIEELDLIIDDLITMNIAEIQISSRQAGMVPFHIMKDRQKSVEFIDRLSLTTAHFETCARLLQKSREGAVITYGDWFANTDECGVPEPDIVYELWSPRQMKQQLGREYLVVYATSGSIVPAFGTSGRRLRGNQTIAVRREIAEAANLKEITSPQLVWSEVLP